MRTSGSKSLDNYTARFRASLGSVLFTECVMTLNWLGLTAGHLPATWSARRQFGGEFRYVLQ
jgi:hypothetical protein